MRLTLTIAVTLILALTCAVPDARASTTNELSSGSLSVGAQELIVGSKWDQPTTRISWQITQTSPGVWHYQYTWDVGGTQGNLSHFLLEVTNPARASDFFNFTNTQISGGDPKMYQAYTNPNGEMPYNIYGIKFTAPGGTGWNAVDVTFAFDSTHSPTWGDFFARDGNNGWAYNKNFSDASVGGNLNDGFHIAVPNGPAAPLPAAVWLLGSGLVGLVALRKRRRGKK